MKKVLLVLLWSVISAAFIGPGTVTTAASSGSHFKFTLLWALLFSTLACLVLQEASARITTVSGLNLGEALRKKFQNGPMGVFVILMILGAIILGSAAYEAGNILGSVAGATLQIHLPSQLVTLGIGFLAGVLLYFGNVRTVARLLGFIVAVMGIVFIVTSIVIKPGVFEVIRGLFIPSVPEGSPMYILGLIGTTVVPYNLFLGSGIAEGQSIKEMRFGLSIAVLIGGVISMAVLVVGTAVIGEFSYQGLVHILSDKLGKWSSIFFAIGLFTAGFSSAVTAPLAAAITAKSIFQKDDIEKWSEKKWRYRSIWMLVLTTGIVFGLLKIKPIPAIIAAQALNGVLLPFVSVFLFVVVNDISLMGIGQVNKIKANIVLIIVILISIILGLTNLLKAASSIFHLPAISENLIILFSVILMGIIFLFIKKRSE